MELRECMAQPAVAEYDAGQSKMVAQKNINHRRPIKIKKEVHIKDNVEKRRSRIKCMNVQLLLKQLLSVK